jgi:translocator protein
MENKQTWVWPLINLIGITGTIYVNYLANAIPLGGMNTGELSALYPNLFVPAGITFSIWGIIYLFLIFFVGFQWLVFFQKKEIPLKGPHFLMTCLANIAWIFAWHYRYMGISVGVMLFLLSILIILLHQAHSQRKQTTPANRWFTVVPFSLYAGWISIALIANVTAFLIDLRWTGWGIPPVYWTVIMIIVGVLISATIVMNYGDILFGIVTIWALLGIILKRQQISNPEETIILYTCWIGVALLLALFLRLWWRKKTMFCEKQIIHQ